MRRKNMTLSVVLLAGTLAIASAGAIFASSGGNDAIINAETETPTINLKSGTNHLFASGEGHTDPGTSTILTGYGNEIGINYAGFADTIADGTWHTIEANGYFENTTVLNGLSSITFALDNAEGVESSVKIEWSRTSGSYASSDSETISISDSLTHTCDFGGRNPTYFRLTNAGEGTITIKDATILFSCSESALPVMTTKDYEALSAPYANIENATLTVKSNTIGENFTSLVNRSTQFDGAKVHDVNSYSDVNSGNTNEGTSDYIYDGAGYQYELQDSGSYARSDASYVPVFTEIFYNYIYFDANVISAFQKDGDVYRNSVPYYRDSYGTLSLSADGAAVTYTEVTINIDASGALIGVSYKYRNGAYAQDLEVSMTVSEIGTTSVTVPETWVTPGETEWNAGTSALSSMTVGQISRNVSKYSPSADGSEMTVEDLGSIMLEVNGDVAQEQTSLNGNYDHAYYRMIDSQAQKRTQTADGTISAWENVNSMPTLAERLASYGLIGDNRIFALADFSFDHYFALKATKQIAFDASTYSISSGTTHYIKDISLNFDENNRFSGISIQVYDPDTYSGDGAPSSDYLTAYSFYSIYYSFAYESILSSDEFPVTADEVWDTHLASLDGLVNGYLSHKVQVGDSEGSLISGLKTDLEVNEDVAMEDITTTDYAANTESTESHSYKMEGDQPMMNGVASDWSTVQAMPTLKGYLDSALGISSSSSWLDASDLTYSYGYYNLSSTDLTVAMDAEYNLSAGTGYSVTSLQIEISNDRIKNVIIGLSGTGEDTNTYNIVFEFVYETKLTADYLLGVTRDKTTEFNVAKSVIDAIRGDANSGGVGTFQFIKLDMTWPTADTTNYSINSYTQGVYHTNGDLAFLYEADYNTYATVANAYYRREGENSYIYDYTASPTAWASSDYFLSSSSFFLGSVYSLLEASSFAHTCSGTVSTFEFSFSDVSPNDLAYALDANGNVVAGSTYGLYRLVITLNYGELNSIYLRLRGATGDVTNDYQVQYFNLSTSTDLSENDYPFNIQSI